MHTWDRTTGCLSGTRGRCAPKGTQYYAAYRGDELALNMVDADDKRFFPDEMMGKGIRMGADTVAGGRGACALQ